MVKARVEGGEELARALGSLSTRLSRRVLGDALLDGGEPIRKRTSQLAARAPGKPDIADNINIAPVRAESATAEAAVGIGVPKQFYYDTMLEFGTVHMSAQPFYRPAFDEQAQRSIGVIGQSLWSALAGRGMHRETSVLDLPVSGPGSLL